VGTFFTWAYAVLGFCLLVEAIAGSWEFIKGVDLGFSKARAEEFERKFDLRKAREQQTVVSCLGLPLGLIVAGAMSYHLWWSFTAEIYTYLAIAWFVSAPLRRYWQVATSIRLDARLLKLGLKDELTFDTPSAWQATKRYYARGFARPLPYDGKKRRGLFAYRLRWLNKFAWLWQWMRHLRVIVPIAVEGLVSLIWPLTATFMVGYHCSNALQMEGAVRPWWSRKHI
jgi:hypothetical protein